MWKFIQKNFKRISFVICSIVAITEADDRGVLFSKCTAY